MQFPITIGLHRSFIQSALLWLLASSALLAILATAWSALWQAGLSLCVLALALLAGRYLKHPVRSLVLSSEGILAIRLDGSAGDAVAVALLPGATVNPWLTVFRVDYKDRRLVLLITPDCIAAEDFRRLRVWLKWRAIFGGNDGGV